MRKRLHGLLPSALLAEGLRPADDEETPALGWTVPSVEALGPLFPEFEILRTLGHGGMGSVYEAHDRNRKRKVALKVLPVELSELDGMAARFRSEAEVLGRVRHPGIVDIYDFGVTEQGHLYYSMEFVEGEDLASRLDRGPLPLRESIAILQSLAESLSVLHRHGIVHRDLKPANILLQPDGQPRLVDFGLAISLEREMAAPRITHRSNALGTLEYAAPEQIAGGRTGPAADLYSLGVVAYELLTGELPRGVFDPPSYRNRNVEPSFDGAVMAALQSDPARRPGSAKEFALLLAGALERSRSLASREKHLRRRARRHLGLSAVLALAMLSLAALAWFAIHERRAALIQTERAEKFQAGAEALLTFVVGDLESQLEEMGRLDALDESLSRVERYFEETREQTSANDPAALSRHASFFRNRALVRLYRGDYQRAAADLQRSLPLRKKAAHLAPNNVSYRLELSRCLVKLGEVSSLMGSDREALTWSERARDTVGPVRPGWGPGSPLLLARLQADRLHGSLLAKLNRRPEARALLLQVQELARRNQPNPAEPPMVWQSEQAAVEFELGLLEREDGNFAAALARFESALQIYRHAHNQSEWRLSTARATCSAATQIGAILLKSGKSKEAIGALNEAAELLEEISRRSPGGPYLTRSRQEIDRLLIEARQDPGKGAP